MYECMEMPVLSMGDIQVNITDKKSLRSSLHSMPLGLAYTDTTMHNQDFMVVYSQGKTLLLHFHYSDLTCNSVIVIPC
jgi:hypothetical protein